MEVDKILHFLVGLGIMLFSAFFIAPHLGLLVTCVAGIGKEVYDRYHPNHNADIKDALATILGGLIGYGFIIGVTYA